MENNINLWYQEDDIDKYNQILVDEIINIIVKKIQEKCNGFKYTNIVKLIEVAEEKLKPSEYDYLKELYLIERSETGIDTEELLEIYIALRDTEENKYNYFNEVVGILNKLGESYKLKIPKNILEIFNKKAEKDNIEIKENIKDLDIDRGTLIIIKYLNLKYWKK